jgi:hypothetical protein
MMNAMQDMQKQIAEALGISGLSDAEQQKIIEDFGAVALQASTAAIIEALPEEKREEFVRLVESGDEDAAQAFLASALPNFEEISGKAVQEELAHFKDFQKTL